MELRKNACPAAGRRGTAMDSQHRFIIEDGVLTGYSGPGGNVTVPEGVTEIGSGAFSNCRELTEITLPQGVTHIGSQAFRRCANLVRAHLPAGLTGIGSMAFYRCRNLQSLIIPDSVTDIGDHAFADCEGLRSICFSRGTPKLGRNIFGAALPECLVENALDLYELLDDDQLRRYLLRKKIWDRLEPDEREEIFLARQGDSLADAYRDAVSPEDADAFAETLLLRVLPGSSGGEAARKAAFLMTALYSRLSPRRLLELYECLEAREDASEALSAVRRSAGVAEKIGSLQFFRSGAERAVMLEMTEAGLSARGLERRLKEFFGLSLSDLPALSDRDGNPTASFVAAWLLTVNETYADSPEEEGLRPAREAPGPGPEAARIAQMLSPSSLQEALLVLSDRVLGEPFLTKLLYLARPLCRYADETTMAELYRRWKERRGADPDEGPASHRIFREAVLYSRTRTAMTLARQAGALDRYLALRISEKSHPGAFVIRDGVLTEYRGPGGDVVIPEGVTAIGDNAFNAVRGYRESLEYVTALDRGEKDPPEGIRLTGVTIPGTVRSIGAFAFSCCAWLTSVTVPESVDSIGTCAFHKCRRLSLAVIPERTEVGQDAFAGCPGFLEIRRV